MEGSEQAELSSHQFIHQICHTQYTNMSYSCAAFGFTNRGSATSLQFFRIPSAKRCLEQGIINNRILTDEDEGCFQSINQIKCISLLYIIIQVT